MTVSLHCSAILGLGDSARLRTEIGELSIARESFAGFGQGNTKATSSFPGCTSRRQPGTVTCWCCSGRSSRITSSRAPKRMARRPTRGRTQRPSPSRAGGSGKAVRPSSSYPAGCPPPGPKRGAPLYGLSVPEVLLRFEHPVKANRQVIPEG